MVSPSRTTAMRNAIANGDDSKVRLLLKAGVPASGHENGYPFLCLAASLGREEIFDRLVLNGASLKTPELIEWAVDGSGGRQKPSLKIVQTILDGTNGEEQTLTKALRFACVSGNVDVVRLLIQKGADPNGIDAKHKDFPLSNAVCHGHAEIVEALLTAGADLTIPVFEEDDAGDWTTLSLVDLAIRSGFADIAKMVG